MSTSCEIVLKWKPQNNFDEKSALVQVMAWWHQATSHYLNQCWPRSMSQYGVTRLQRHWLYSLLLCGRDSLCILSIDQIHKSHNEPVPYPTIHHFGTEMCPFLFQSGRLIHSFACKIGLFICDRLVYLRRPCSGDARQTHVPRPRDRLLMGLLLGSLLHRLLSIMRQLEERLLAG